ncbi:hypothetical protein ACN20G_35520 (plasmid) [Streptomyces sp. BI20]|uniref:hypothetical protein n=1 Tax=Streptomyces sp. BI20 TaxID=3403460 RepID=UPI003C762547
MSTARCQGDGCRARQAAGTSRRLAPRGRTLCSHCRDILGATLGELTHLYEECERILAGPALDGLREKTGGGSLPGLPFNGPAAEARSGIVALLGSWSGLVAQERELDAPTRDVPRLASFLTCHLDWLAAHPAAADLSVESARLARAARRIAFPDPARTIRLGRCPEPDCAGALTAAVHRTGRPTGNPEIRCTASPTHRWSSDRWIALRASLDSDGPAPRPGDRASAPAAPAQRWLAAPDVARLWHASVSTVYRLASEERWRRRTRAGRTYYNEDDVRACFARRAARTRPAGS